MSLQIRTHEWLVDHFHYYEELEDTHDGCFYFHDLPDVPPYILYLYNDMVTLYYPKTEIMVTEFWEEFTDPESVIKWLHQELPHIIGEDVETYYDFDI